MYSLHKNECFHLWLCLFVRDMLQIDCFLSFIFTAQFGLYSKLINGFLSQVQGTLIRSLLNSGKCWRPVVPHSHWTNHSRSFGWPERNLLFWSQSQRLSTWVQMGLSRGNLLQGSYNICYQNQNGGHKPISLKFTIAKNGFHFHRMIRSTIPRKVWLISW